MSQEEEVDIGNSKSMSFDKSSLKFFICLKNIHLKKDRSYMGKDDYVQIKVSLDEDGYKSYVVLVVTSWETKKIWVIDSG